MNTRIVIAGLWVSVMLTYLLGDVIRIFAGDYEAGKFDGVEATQIMWMIAAVMMLIPIVMLVLNLIFINPSIRLINIIAAAVLIVFNLAGLPYAGVYDNFLIIVGILFKVIILIYSWKWIV
jgi:hypothetical protein